jgi:hypothetical protein
MPLFASYDVTLNAFDAQEFAVEGTFVGIVQADGAIKIEIDGTRTGDFFAGGYYEMPGGQKFSRVKVIDTSGASNTVKVSIGTGRFDDRRVTIDPATGTLAVAAARPGTFDSVADTTRAAGGTTLLIAADADVTEYIVANPPTNSVTVRLGDNPAAANGIPLAPGERIKIAVTAALYIHNPGAVAQSIALARCKF